MLTSELCQLREAWEAERTELNRRQLLLAAVDASIAGGHYKQAQALLDREAEMTRRGAPLHFTISIEPVVQATVVDPVLLAAAAEERREDATTKKKKKRQRVDRSPGQKRQQQSEKSAPRTTKLKATGRPRNEKEGFEWHSSVSNHTKYRCLQCGDVVGVRVLANHACG